MISIAHAKQSCHQSQDDCNQADGGDDPVAHPQPVGGVILVFRAGLFGLGQFLGSFELPLLLGFPFQHLILLELVRSLQECFFSGV